MAKCVVFLCSLAQDESWSQRFKCKDCKRTFSLESGSFMHYTRKREKWLVFVLCMLQGLSLNKIIGQGAENQLAWLVFRLSRFFTGVTKSFMHCKRLNRCNSKELLKHKTFVLNQKFRLDETFFHESSKGTIVHHRPARKNGRDCHKRGLSMFQICVMTVRDRTKQSFAKVVGRVKPSF